MKTKTISLRLAAVVSLMLAAFGAFAAGLPGVTIDVVRGKVHHAGVAVIMDFIITNHSVKPVSVYLDANPFENHRNVMADGETYSLDGAGEYNVEVPPGESVKRTLYVDNVPYNVKSFDKIIVKGRSSLSNKNNPYGEFSYTITDVPIPAFHNSNLSGCFFLDTEFGMTVDKVTSVGDNLEVICTLTNNGKWNKTIYPQQGKAADCEGDEYEAEDPHPYSSTEIASGDSGIVKVIVKGAAKRNLKKIRMMYDIQEQGGERMSYPVLLQLDGATAR